jgi:hypothetical protein
VTPTVTLGIQTLTLTDRQTRTLTDRIQTSINGLPTSVDRIKTQAQTDEHTGMNGGATTKTAGMSMPGSQAIASLLGLAEGDRDYI